MSLLKDVFLENEAGEAQELERIIEGDEFDERPLARSDSDENSAKEDEAEEDKRRVDPTSAKPKRVIKNPRFVLNPARLTGPRGIQVVTEHFKDFKFKGKGHEREDLDLVLKKLEHWAYRLYPKFEFADCLKKIETLGKKRPVAVHLQRIRTDQITSDETVVQKDSSDDEATPVQAPEEDEFDKLLQQQIEIARATPAPSSVKKTPLSDRSSMMPKITSSPSINDEQRERMLKSRKMAEERRLARLKQNTSQEIIVKENVPKSPMKNNDVSVENSQNNLVIESSDVVMNSVNEIRDVTVELDNDGMVVTKSPKCLISANKRKKSVVDNSEDVESADHSNIVELDNDGMVVTKSVKTYVPAKKHKKSRINSSDDDDDSLVNDPITVDVEHHNSLAKSSQNITNQANDSSSDDDLVVSESITVDVENHNSSLAKSSKNITNKSNDSSSDDDLVVSESITVDVENHNSSLAKSSKNITNKSNDSSSDDDLVVSDQITFDVEHHNSLAKTSKSTTNKSNDSSSDNDLVVSDQLTVDVEHRAKSSKNTKKKSNIIYTSEDIALSESVDVDKLNTVKKHNRSNFIDSSDSDDDIDVDKKSQEINGQNVA